MDRLSDSLRRQLRESQWLSVQTLRKRFPEVTQDLLDSFVRDGILKRKIDLRDPVSSQNLKRLSSEELARWKSTNQHIPRANSTERISIHDLIQVPVYAIAGSLPKYVGLNAVSGSDLVQRVIFGCDLVSFSENPSPKQLQQVTTLSAEIQDAASTVGYVEKSFFAIPTGDGFFLVIDDEDGLRVFRFIDQLLRSIRSHTIDLPMRIGVHFGSFYELTHEDGTRNAIGNAINVAARVMSFGFKNHVLITRSLFESHIAGTSIQESFHEAGTGHDKHGNPHTVFNYYHDDVGNSGNPNFSKDA